MFKLKIKMHFFLALVSKSHYFYITVLLVYHIRGLHHRQGLECGQSHEEYWVDGQLWGLCFLWTWSESLAELVHHFADRCWLSLSRLARFCSFVEKPCRYKGVAFNLQTNSPPKFVHRVRLCSQPLRRDCIL